MRRDGYTDRATPPVTGGAKRSRYTGTVNDTLAVAVDCCAGYRGEETPRRFTFKNQLVEIRTIVDQWRTPDHRYFKVRTAAGEVDPLRQDVRSGAWELTELGSNVSP